jgi:hypothetical protein
MTTTTFAAIESSNHTGTVYALGPTPEAAVAAAIRDGGDPCVSHDERGPGHRPEDHYSAVPCSPAAAAYVEENGGAPSREVSVTHRGVTLRSEEE